MAKKTHVINAIIADFKSKKPEYGMQEIANRNKVSYNTAKSHIAKYKKQLKVELIEEVYDDVTRNKLIPIVEEIANGKKLQKVFTNLLNALTPEVIAKMVEDGDTRGIFGGLNIIGGLVIKSTESLGKTNTLMTQETYNPDDDKFVPVMNDGIKNIGNPSDLIDGESYVQED